MKPFETRWVVCFLALLAPALSALAQEAPQRNVSENDASQRPGDSSLATLVERYFRPAPPTVVEITADVPGATAEEVERKVARPLEIMLAGMPYLESLRTKCMPEMAWLQLGFRAGTEFSQAEKEFKDRIAALGGELPSGVVPRISPASSGRAIVRYILGCPSDRSGSSVYSLHDLRAVQDRVIQRQLAKVRGVAGVSTFGGGVKRYEIWPDPARLARNGISARQLEAAIAKGNARWAGGRDPLGSQEVLAAKDAAAAAAFLQAEEDGRLREIRQVVISGSKKDPVRVEDVVEGGPAALRGDFRKQGVVVGHQYQWGRVGRTKKLASGTGWSDEDDLVGGCVWLGRREDIAQSLHDVMAKIDELNASHGVLPPGVRIDVFYEGRGGAARLETQDMVAFRHNIPVLEPERVASRVREVRALLRTFSAVREVVSLIGRPDDGSEPTGSNEAQFLVLLEGAGDKTGGGDKRSRKPELSGSMSQEVARMIPGVSWRVVKDGQLRDEFARPINASRGEHVVTILDPDLRELQELAFRTGRLLAKIPGASGVSVPLLIGSRLQFAVDREKCVKWGATADEVTAVVQFSHGLRVNRIVEGERKSQVVLCWPPWMCGNEVSILDLPVATSGQSRARGDGPDAAPRFRLRDFVTPVDADGRPDPKGSFTRPCPAAIYRTHGSRVVEIRFTIQGRGSDAAMQDAKDKLLVEIRYTTHGRGSNSPIRDAKDKVLKPDPPYRIQWDD